MKVNLKINETLPGRDVKQKVFIYKQAVATTTSGLIGMCVGINFGITAVLLPQLREDKTIQYEPSHESWIASISALSMIIGSLSCGTILDSYGRKRAHIIVCVPIIIGWTVIACANSTSIILVGRFIIGLSTGANKAVTMVYIGELADPKVRSAALFVPGLMAHIGILFSHVVGYYTPWKISCIICIIPAGIAAIAFVFLKESPLWLISKGRTEEGIETFRWFRGTSDASENELKSLLERQAETPQISVSKTLEAVRTRAFIIPMLILIVVMLDIQLSGVNVVSFYSQDIFKQAFAGNVDPFMMMIVMDCIRGAIAFGICLCGKFMNFPKKIAFITSSFGVSLFVAGLVACLMLNYETFIWAPVLCLVMYISFSSAIVTIGWTFVPELLPSCARGLGSGLNSSVAYLSLFAIVKTTPSFMNSYGEPALFAFYGISTLTCGVILSFILPETNGKTLQSIEDSYNKKKVEQSAL